MNQAETVQLLAVIAEAYPSFQVNEGTLPVWHEMLQDMDFNLAKTALKQYIMQNNTGFAPSVGQIRNTALEQVQGQRKTGLEAWGIFRKYINIYSTHEDYQMLKAMYPDIYELVKAVGGRELLLGNADFVRPEFERMYQQYSDKLTNQALLPEAFRDEVASLKSTVYAQLEAGEGA